MTPQPKSEIAIAFERFNGRAPRPDEITTLLRKAAVVDDCNIDPILTIVLLMTSVDESHARAALAPKQLALAAANATAAIVAAGQTVADRIEALSDRRGTDFPTASKDRLSYRIALAIGGVILGCAMMLGVIVWRAGFFVGFESAQSVRLLSFRRYACEVQESMAHEEARRGDARAAAEIRRVSAGC